MSKKISFVLFFSLLLFCSCASYYRAIQPEVINFPPKNTPEKVEIAYRYDVLREVGNKKYVNSEYKKNIKIVAVKLTNNTNAPINTNDIEFYLNDSKIVLLSPYEIQTRIKQSSGAYCLYFIGCLSLAPLDIAVFGAIGVGNIIVASEANKKLYNELLRYDISNREIEKGESVVGIIGFNGSHSDPIEIRTRQ